MSTCKSELDVVIAEVKEQFRLFLTKRSELVLRLGRAYEQVVRDVGSICEEIKNVLHDEIVQKVISRRDIERYCPDKWKQKTKPKNDKLSFSSENGSRRKNVDSRKIKATTATEGISVMEPLEPASLQIDDAARITLKEDAGEILNVANIKPEYIAPQSGIGYDGLTRSELLGVIRQLQKEVTYLNERCNQYGVTISELEDALAKTSFKPADEVPKIEIKEVVVDLEKFGALLFAAIRNRKKKCSIQIDQTGNAIRLSTAAEEINEVTGPI